MNRGNYISEENLRDVMPNRYISEEADEAISDFIE
jgi:hypothetical protein